MSDVRVIEVKQSVFANNGRRAHELRARLRERGVFLLNLMSSPGSGKTSLLRRTAEALADRLPFAVMEADIDSDVDARTMAAAGVRAIQLHTGGMCHLDATMTEQGLDELLADGEKDGARREQDGAPSEKNLAPAERLVILENVGNLVCPAEFDTGAAANAMILSVPEGDDKPLKYPLMFSICDVIVINKIDALPVFDTFSMERAVANIRARNPRAEVIPVSAKTGEGIDAWVAWLERAVERWQSA